MVYTFVPAEFEVPLGLVGRKFVLEPLGPEHNERDHVAWTSSIDHIRATPGFDVHDNEDPWPRPMTLDENMADMRMHRDHFEGRDGFTYTVLDPEDRDVVGCVYIYPAKDDAHDAHVSSWVRASSAELDEPLWRAVSDWLARAWPFRSVDYASRG